MELGANINLSTCVVVITIANRNWPGSETITFAVSDIEPLSDSKAAIFCSEFN